MNIFEKVAIGVFLTGLALCDVFLLCDISFKPASDFFPIAALVSVVGGILLGDGILFVSALKEARDAKRSL